MGNNASIKRMEIYMAKLFSQGGSVQCGERPVLIVQNNIEPYLFWNRTLKTRTK